MFIQKDTLKPSIHNIIAAVFFLIDVLYILQFFSGERPTNYCYNNIIEIIYNVHFQRLNSFVYNMETKGFVEFQIIIHVFVSSFRFIWISICYRSTAIIHIVLLFFPTVFRRRWRLKKVPLVKGLMMGHIYSSKRAIKITVRAAQWKSMWLFLCQRYHSVIFWKK